MSAAVVAALAASVAVMAPAAALDAGDDAIRAKHAQLGTVGPPNGPLGAISSTADGGKLAEFSKWNTTVTITWRSDVGAHWFSGAVRDRWVAAGGADTWGHAAIDQSPTTGRPGEAVRYTSDISVYYSNQTGARALYGGGRGKYWQLNSTAGIAGFPMTDVTAEPSVQNGEFADFQNGVGIYSSPTTGAHWNSGAIRGRFLFHGAGKLGYPTSDQEATQGANGNYALFGPGRAIIYGPQTGAWLVADDFLERLRADGDVAIDGLPTNERTPLEAMPEAGSYQHFQFGTILGTPTGTWSVLYDLRAAWWQFGGYTGPLGLPIGNEVWLTDFLVTQDFEHGFIDCDYIALECIGYQTGQARGTDTASADHKMPLRATATAPSSR